MKKIYLPKQQRQIMMAAGIVLGTILLFFILIYIPKKLQMGRLKGELSQLQSLISEVETIAGGKEKLAEGALALKSELAQLEGCFLSPADVTGLLGLLSEKARRFDMDVVYVKPSAIRPFSDNKGSQVCIEDKACKKLDVELDMRASYMALGRFTEFIQDSTSPLLIVDRMKVEKQASDASKLRITLVVSAFVCSTEAENE